jgi:predicted nucleic acid-binding Zn ribbon protein
MGTEGDHRHCKVCGKVTKPDAETCSPACAAARERRVRASGSYRLLLYAAIALLLIALVVSPFLR